MRRKTDSPFEDYDIVSCVMRFFGALLFGLFLDIVILCCCGMVLLMGYRPGFGWLSYTLIIVPLIWGLGGIFFFPDMLDLANEIIERFFLFWR